MPISRFIFFLPGLIFLSAGYTSADGVDSDGTEVIVLSDLLAGSSPNVEIWGSPQVVQTAEYGAVVEFDGVGDAIFLDERPLKGLTEFTVEALIRPAAGGSLEPRFLHIGEVNGGRLMLEARLTEDGQWALDGYLRAGENYLVLLDRELLHPVGQWTRVALVVRDGQVKTFVNGEFELEGALAFLPIDSGAMSIGVRMNKKHWFKGAIHSIRISPKALYGDLRQD